MYVALAGPLVALGVLLLLQELERWFAETTRRDEAVAQRSTRTRASR
jgi:hypothetical protein